MGIGLVLSALPRHIIALDSEGFIVDYGLCMTTICMNGVEDEKLVNGVSVSTRNTSVEFLHE
jgi:hypothetical protein